MAIKHLTGRSNKEIWQYISKLKPVKHKDYYGKIFLLNVDVTLDGVTEKRNVLYFCIDNIWFLKYVVSAFNLELLYITLVHHDMVEIAKFMTCLTTCTNIKYIISDDANILKNGILSLQHKAKIDWRGRGDVCLYQIIRGQHRITV